MNKGNPNQERESPRAQAAIEVEVEVAGEKQKVQLTTKDIGAGGMFLHTENPAALWKRVKLSFDLPDGKRFEVGGEVVRSLSPEKAKEKKQPPGMAVAFDEVSRPRRKQLIDLVLELCSRRPQAAAEPKPPPQLPPQPPVKKKDEADRLLAELDALLDSVEKVEPPPQRGPEPDDAAVTIQLPEEEPSVVRSPAPPPPQAANLREALRKYQSAIKGDTHYAVLLLPLDAGAKQIDQAYRDLLGQLQFEGPADGLPADVRNQLSAVLARIRKAYAILSKPDRKRAYDFLIDNLHEEL